jgi:hypothetical protein
MATVQPKTLKQFLILFKYLDIHLAEKFLVSKSNHNAQYVKHTPIRNVQVVCYAILVATRNASIHQNYVRHSIHVFLFIILCIFVSGVHLNLSSKLVLKSLL